jgi:(1->4)-alpha-D-glucan 1-alpha-D-glucosylmutase
LRLTTPGVPDLYQGTEGWDLSLVDPDNRRPVDFALRRQWLDDPSPWPALLQQWRSGQCKARLVAQLLQLRASLPELFARGDYKPLRAEGHASAHVLAFRRQHADATLVVAVPRLLGSAEIVTPLLPAAQWRDDALVLPDGRYQHVPDGRVLEVHGGRVALAELFLHSPVAVLATVQ